MSLAVFCSQAISAQLRYYGALGGLAARAARALAGGVVQVSRAPGRNTALLLESESGSCAVGMFLVENQLREPVSASVAPSAFVDAEGHEVQPRLAFSPQVVRLEPGEQALVRVAAAFDERLRPGVRYRGTISVPGVSSGSVALVLRRRDTAATLAREP